MSAKSKSARDWFIEAERCYLENHQGCPWCGGSHRVFQCNEGENTVYFCQACDFKAVRNSVNDSYQHIPGEASHEELLAALYAI